MPQNSKFLIGAVVAAALAFAVYYGLISQQTANGIQSQANQTLGTAPAAQQTAVPQNTTGATPNATAPQNNPQAPR